MSRTYDNRDKDEVIKYLEMRVEALSRRNKDLESLLNVMSTSNVPALCQCSECRDLCKELAPNLVEAIQAEVAAMSDGEIHNEIARMRILR